MNPSSVSAAPTGAGVVFDDIRRSCARAVALIAKETDPLVTIDEAALKRELATNADAYSEKCIPPDWAQDYHYFDGTDLTAQYILVLDALNFCFWPLPEYEYNHLASSLKRTLERDRHSFDADRLSKVDAEQLTRWLRVHDNQEIPMAVERARLIRELGTALSRHFDGSAANLIRSANGVAADLVALVTAHFPGFRDHAVYRGEQAGLDDFVFRRMTSNLRPCVRQIFFYKRAQIFVGDVWGAFKGQGLGHFDDIATMTCFAGKEV